MAMGLLSLLFVAIWLMLPVYMANNFATLLGGGPPIDGGRYFYDGRRVLGDNKTCRGFILGSLGGIVVGALQALSTPYLPLCLIEVLHASYFTPHPLAALVAMPIGALTGDAVKSFFKRRLGVASGATLPIADQLDFIAGSLVFGFVADQAWFISVFTLPVLAMVVIMTFPIQLFHNTIAVIIGKKKAPW